MVRVLIFKIFEDYYIIYLLNLWELHAICIILHSYIASKPTVHSITSFDS